MTASYVRLAHSREVLNSVQALRGRLGRPAGAGDGGSSSRNQGGNAFPLLQVHSGLVEVLLEADEHIPNLGWRTQFEYRVGDGVVAKDQERRELVLV